MKVLLVNSYDRGGAAQACIRLHLGLLKAGIDSKLLLLFKANTDIQQSFQFDQPMKPKSFVTRLGGKVKNTFILFKLLQPPAREFQREDEYRHARQQGLEGVSFPYTPYDITASSYYQEADIINFHWVSDFLDWKTFFRKNTKPVIWTLHDENAFLGGNHYEEVFYGMDNIYNALPRKISKLESYWENKLGNLKEEALDTSKQTLTIVTPSRWLYNKSRESKLFSPLQHHCIPYGLDTTVFRRLDKEFSRTVLNLPKDKKLLLFVSDAIESNRKGYEYLEKALQQLAMEDKVALFAIGRNKNKKNSNFITFLGAVNDQLLMCVAYSAADLFVIPSLEDNLPNTVIESLCCGTPVAGFNIGGLPDMVTNGVNGFLSEALSVNGLLAAIKKCLDFNFDRLAVAKAASKQYDDAVQANNYIHLYKQVLQG